MSTQLVSISPALSRLLSKSIDYAGLFPPASLPLSESLEMFRRYLNGRESWIIASIVLPIDRLTEAARFLPETPFHLTAIPLRTDNPRHWLSCLKEECEHLPAFLSAPPQVAIQALEIPFQKPGDAEATAKRNEELVPLMNGYRVFV